jgi:hypothetical protein
LPNGLPDNHITCKADDPACDAVLGDKACTINFRVCFNLIDLEERFICTAAGPVTNVYLHAPLQNRPSKPFDVENRDSWEAVILKLGGTISAFKKRSIGFNPPLADTVCSDTIPWKVPLRQNSRTLALSPRKTRINWHVYRLTGFFDGDHLFLRCTP